MVKHSKGYKVAPHLHIRDRSGIVIGSEALIVVRGRIKVALFDESGQYLEEVELREGMGIVMCCGHSVEFLEESVVIEVKEGPYPGAEEDKVWL